MFLVLIHTSFSCIYIEVFQVVRVQDMTVNIFGLHVIGVLEEWNLSVNERYMES